MMSNWTLLIRKDWKNIFIIPFLTSLRTSFSTNSSLLVHDCYFTCTKPTPSKNKPSVKVCGLWIVRVSWHVSAVLGHSTIVWQQIYHFQMMQALIWTRQKCCKHGLSNGPDHQQNLKITFLVKFCKDVALSQSDSAKGRRQLLHQVRNGLLSVPAWTRVGHGRLGESSGSSPMHSLLNILAYSPSWVVEKLSQKVTA